MVQTGVGDGGLDGSPTGALADDDELGVGEPGHDLTKRVHERDMIFLGREAADGEGHRRQPVQTEPGPGGATRFIAGQISRAGDAVFNHRARRAESVAVEAGDLGRTGDDVGEAVHTSTEPATTWRVVELVGVLGVQVGDAGQDCGGCSIEERPKMVRVEMGRSRPSQVPRHPQREQRREPRGGREEGDVDAGRLERGAQRTILEVGDHLDVVASLAGPGGQVDDDLLEATDLQGLEEMNDAHAHKEAQGVPVPIWTSRGWPHPCIRSMRRCLMRAVTDVAHVLELNRRFHDDVEANTYDARMGVEFSPSSVGASVAELERVLGQPLPRGGVVLDVGAGTGNLAVKLAMDGRFDRVVAVDISAGMLQEAARSAERCGVALETVVSDMVRLPFPDQSVDVVVGCAVLHHLPDPVAFLQEVRRVLKPGAPTIFIGEPSTTGERLTHLVKFPLLLAVRAARTFGFLPQPVWEHEAIDVHTFTIDDVDQLLAGFQQKRLAPEGFLAPIVDQGLLAPILLVSRGAAPVRKTLDAVRGGLRALDAAVGERVPAGWRVSMKLAGFAPAVEQ